MYVCMYVRYIIPLTHLLSVFSHFLAVHNRTSETAVKRGSTVVCWKVLAVIVNCVTLLCCLDLCVCVCLYQAVYEPGMRIAASKMCQELIEEKKDVRKIFLTRL